MGKWMLRQKDGSVTSISHRKDKRELIRILKMRRKKGEKGWRLVLNPKYNK